MSTKIKSLKLENFAKYANIDVNFDENLTYLVGANGSGKSTLGISAIWFMFQGIAEKSSGGNTPLIGERFRFIGNAAPTAKGEMVLYDESKGIEIKVKRTLSKSGSEVRFEAPEGVELNQQWLTELFNVFLISPKKFTELSGKQQAELLGIDTSKFDHEIKLLKDDFTFINREFRQFENIREIEKVERVNVNELILERNQIITFNIEQSTKSQAIEFEKQKKQSSESELVTIGKMILELQEKERLIAERINNSIKTIGLLPKPEVPKSTSEIDEKINQASSTNEKANQYDLYVNDLAKKEAKSKELIENKQKQTECENRRIEAIKAKKLPFSNLTIDEEGGLLMDGKPIKEPYFSTGEIIKLIPILLSSQNQELKYVFIQDFNLLDEDKQADVEKYLTEKGFQLVIEYIGKKEIDGKNCILLKDNQVVENYEENKESLKL
jgi:DNA repair ATPase RecN